MFMCVCWNTTVTNIFLFVFYFPLLLFTFFNNIQNILFDIILHQYPNPSFSLYDCIFPAIWPLNFLLPS